ncbi:palmitoyltransferase ZDHHC1 isoform X6 [Odocoileus virginianus]|uniref:Palmitoyltransferase ZDHHC1 isoform X6 n=1 Tax=Odocoileus virginianus TaxID=9874 RepID=A0ABM4GVB4_ODOVR
MYKMNICNKPSNKTAPEKNVWTAPAQASGPSPELQGQRSRRNGWSWPPHPLQIVAWLLYLFFAVIGFGVLVPLLPHHWVPAGYACMGAIFAGHLVVHLTAVSIDPADANVRDKSYAGPLPIFNRSQHAHVIEDLHCNLCDVDVQESWWSDRQLGEGEGVRVPSTAAPATNACAALTTTASGSTTVWARGTTVWHKLTTYEYIVQHRPPQEAKGAHRELESCPLKMRPIQEMELYMRTFSHVRPEPSGQARPAEVNANPSRFLATRGQVEPPPPASPETLALPPRIRPQKKRKRRMYKVPTSGTLDREPQLPRLPGPRTPGRRSSSSSDSADASTAGVYHSASAESLDEIPVAQTRLGSAALAAPVGRPREPGLALQARAPAVFVSPSSGEPRAQGGSEVDLA